MDKPLTPATLGKRMVAGALDAFFLCGLSAAYFLVPLLTTGLVVPMWGVLAAGVGYAVVPLAAFRATLGMKLLGLELVGKDGHAANPGDLLFRELVGRGLLPGAFLFTLVMSFVGSLLHVTRFAMPTGVGFMMALVSLLTMAVVVPGHFFPLFRPDRRSLADMMSRTQVIPARAVALPEDEDERADYRSARRKRIIGVTVFELILVAGALALPRFLSSRTTSTEEYADRITRTKLEKEFERAPQSEVIARELAEAYRKAGRDEDAKETLQRQLEATVAAVGCEKERALSLGDRLNGEGKYDAAVRLVSDFEKKCGPWLRLEWVSLYAHQQLGAWQDVADGATRLIDAEPEDSDYWWWRGEAFAKLGQYEQAAADYHQSMANKPNGFASGRYAQWAGAKLHRPCEAAFAIGAWMDADPDDFSEWAPGERTRLYLAGDCDRLLGKGKAQLKLNPAAPASTATFEVAGKSGTWELTQSPGYTQLSKAFAERAGIDLSAAPEVRLRLAGEWGKGKVVTLPEVRFGRAKAADVVAVVVDGLPAGLDGVLGANLAWRFQVRNQGTALAFEARAPVREP